MRCVLSVCVPTTRYNPRAPYSSCFSYICIQQNRDSSTPYGQLHHAYRQKKLVVSGRGKNEDKSKPESVIINVERPQHLGDYKAMLQIQRGRRGGDIGGSTSGGSLELLACSDYFEINEQPHFVMESFSSKAHIVAFLSLHVHTYAPAAGPSSIQCLHSTVKYDYFWNSNAPPLDSLRSHDMSFRMIYLTPTLYRLLLSPMYCMYSGGFGTVHRAWRLSKTAGEEHVGESSESPLSLELVAIKLLKKMNASASSSFKEEMKLMMQMDHENVVKYLDFFEIEGRFHLVMELFSVNQCPLTDLFASISDISFCVYPLFRAHGGDMSRVIEASTDGLSEPEACIVATQILKGLLHLHRRHILHLDLKSVE